MKTILNYLLIVIAGALISHPLAAQVKSDYDRDTDFSKYKSYSFAGWQKDSDQQLNEFDKKRILQALKSEMDARGLTMVDNGGDAVVSIFVALKDKTSTTAYTNYIGGMGMYATWGWGMGSGTATTTYQEDDYTEGTLVLDMFDSGTKSLVWQGVNTTIVKEDPKRREKAIPKEIGKLMKQFPIKPVK